MGNLMNLEYKVEGAPEREDAQNEDQIEIFLRLLMYLTQYNIEENYNAEVDVFNQILEILPQIESIDYFEIAPANLFGIFYNFCENSTIPNFDPTQKIVSIIYKMMDKCCVQFIRDFVYSPLCKLFVDNLNIFISILFSFIISKHKEFNEIFMNYGLFAKLETLSASLPPQKKEYFREITYFIYAQFCKSCDERWNDVYLQLIRNILDSITKEENMNIFKYQIYCITKLIQKNHYLYQYIIGQQFLSYINFILSENNPEKMSLTLRVLRKAVDYVDEIIEPLSQQISINLLVKLIDLKSDTCRIALECVRNILTEDVYPIETIIETGLHMKIVGILEDGLFEEKSLALQCLNNLYITYNCHFPAIYTPETIDTILAQLLDFSFMNSNEDFYSIKTIIISLINDGIDIHPIEMVELFYEIQSHADGDLADECQKIIEEISQLITPE